MELAGLEQATTQRLVVVVDHRTSEKFVLDVHVNDNALEMSHHHPYAYAAHRRSELRLPRSSALSAWDRTDARKGKISARVD